MPPLTKETLMELLPTLYDASQPLGIERATPSYDPTWLAGMVKLPEDGR